MPADPRAAPEEEIELAIIRPGEEPELNAGPPAGPVPHEESMVRREQQTKYHKRRGCCLLFVHGDRSGVADVRFLCISRR